MRPSKTWGKIKKPFFIGVALAISIVVSFGSLHFSGGKAELFFSEILGAFTAVTVFSTTLSIALFNYIDNISKDVSSIDGNHSKIKSALISLSSLKREVILNAVLILTLFVIELAIEGVAKSIDLKNVPFESFYWVAISVRVSIFVLAILAVTEQIRGLMVAIEYRNVIHEGIGSSKRKN